MAATKEQEREALEKIRQIVEALGENSYIGTAFDGCFELAAENIYNDFGCSMKQRWESAEKNAKDFKRAAEYYAAEAEKAEKEVESLKGKVLTTSDAVAIKAILTNSKLEAASMADSSAQIIVEYADRPDSQEFRQAVQDNRNSKKRMDECSTLIQRLNESMSK